jgi:hypothetical protein
VEEHKIIKYFSAQIQPRAILIKHCSNKEKDLARLDL